MDNEKVYVDVLTGVLNRYYLETIAKKEITSYIARNIPFSLVVVDLDHFKQINDVHGHARGDAVLKAFGLFIKKALRLSDTVIRCGGDEFVCIMPNTLRKNAESIYLWILKSLKGERLSGLTITISVGIASYPGDGSDYMSLFAAVLNFSLWRLNS